MIIHAAHTNTRTYTHAYTCTYTHFPLGLITQTYNIIIINERNLCSLQLAIASYIVYNYYIATKNNN